MSSRATRRSTRLLVAALVALTLAPASIAGAQTAGSTTTSPGITCANPPAGAATSAAERDRFVGLWAARVDDASFMQSYMDAPGVPTAILAEGFHALSGPTQGWLVTCLVERLAPAAAEVQRTQAALALIIFEKDYFNRLRAEAQETTPVTDTAPPAAQAAVTAATQQLAATAVPPPPDTSSLVPPAPDLQPVNDLTGNVAQTLTDLAAGNPQPVQVQAGAALEGNVVTPVASAAFGVLVSTGLNGTIAFPILGRLVQIVETLLHKVANFAGNLLAKPPLNVLGGATYRVCRESVTQPVACTVPIPIGVPVPVGLTPDLVPDITAQLGPQPNLFAPQDVTAGFTIIRLPTAPPGPCPTTFSPSTTRPSPVAASSSASTAGRPPSPTAPTGRSR